MLTVTFEQFLAFESCRFKKKVTKEKFEKHFKNGALSALDILKLDDVTAIDKICAVLREELIPTYILHEFARRCAEKALSRIKDSDPRSLEAIRVIRLWLKGKATDKELRVACNAAWGTIWESILENAWEDADAQKWQVKELIKMLEKTT